MGTAERRHEILRVLCRRRDEIALQIILQHSIIIEKQCFLMHLLNSK